MGCTIIPNTQYQKLNCTGRGDTNITNIENWFSAILKKMLLLLKTFTKTNQKLLKFSQNCFKNIRLDTELFGKHCQ